MKQLAIILTLLCCLQLHPTSGQQPSAYFNDQDSTSISGQIIGFKPGDGNDFISLMIYDLSGNGKKHSSQISADGSFDITVLQYFTGDMTLNYRNAFTKIFARPNSHLQIAIQNNAIDSGTRWGPDVFSAKGALGDVNNLIFAFEHEMRDHEFAKEASMGNKQLTDSTFSSQKNERLNEELAFLNTYISNKKIDNTTFINWQRNQLIYEAGYETLLFPFLGKMNKTITDKQLLALISSIPISNSTALCNSAYYDFLRMLTGGHQIIVNINQAYESVKEENGKNAFLVVQNLLDKVTNDITREIMYLDLYHSYYKTPSPKMPVGPALERFENVISDPVLKKVFKNLADSVQDDFKSYNIISRIRGLKVSDHLKTRLLGVFEKAANAPVFIDFWGDWCGPCMAEMPTYPKLIAEFEDKPLKFIFFSVNTNEKSMENVKAKYKINADFINLTNDEVAIVNNVFEFHAYPSHFVVNSQGYVVSNRTKRSEDIKNLLFK